MNVFIKIFDDSKAPLEYKFPQTFCKALKAKKELMQDQFFVEFYSVENGRLTRLYTSDKKIPSYKPEKDQLYIYCDLFWDEYEYMQEEIMAEYSRYLKNSREKRVFLYTTHGDLDRIREAHGIFKESFRDALDPHVAPLMDVEIVYTEWAHNSASKIIKELES